MTVTRTGTEINTVSFPSGKVYVAELLQVKDPLAVTRDADFDEAINISVDDHYAIFSQEQDETTDSNGVKFILDDDGTSTPEFYILTKSGTELFKVDDDSTDVAGNLEMGPGTNVTLDNAGGSQDIFVGTNHNQAYFPDQVGYGGTINTLGNFRINLDVNNNSGSDEFTIGADGVNGVADIIFKIEDDGGVIIGQGDAQVNMTLTSPDGTEWNCGVDNAGAFSCS
jgi:hypothetical protein